MSEIPKPFEVISDDAIEVRDKILAVAHFEVLADTDDQAVVPGEAAQEELAAKLNSVGDRQRVLVEAFRSIRESVLYEGRTKLLEPQEVYAFKYASDLLIDAIGMQQASPPEMV